MRLLKFCGSVPAVGLTRRVRSAGDRAAGHAAARRRCSRARAAGGARSRRRAGIDTVHAAGSAETAQQRVEFLRRGVGVRDRIAQLRLRLRIAGDAAQVLRHPADVGGRLGQAFGHVEQVLVHLRVRGEIAHLVDGLVERDRRLAQHRKHLIDVRRVVVQGRIERARDVDEVLAARIQRDLQRGRHRIELVGQTVEAFAALRGEVVGVVERRLQRGQQVRFAVFELAQHAVEAVHFALAFFEQIAERGRIRSLRLLFERQHFTRQERDLLAARASDRRGRPGAAPAAAARSRPSRRRSAARRSGSANRAARRRCC